MIASMMGQRAPEVVFVPGFMQRGEAWKPVAERLGQRYRVHLLDHRACDRDGRLAEIRAAARPGAALAGYSLGGRLALHAALAEPARYGALALLGASAGIEDEDTRAERRRTDGALAAWMEERPIEEVVRRWEALPVFAGQPQALVDAQRPGRLSHEPRALAALLRSAGQGAMPPVWERLAELGVPVLAIAGERDGPYAVVARRLATGLPRGEARIVPGAGHAAHLEQPASVAALLLDFLDRHPPRTAATG